MLTSTINLRGFSRLWLFSQLALVRLKNDLLFMFLMPCQSGGLNILQTKRWDSCGTNGLLFTWEHILCTVFWVTVTTQGFIAEFLTISCIRSLWTSIGTWRRSLTGAKTSSPRNWLSLTSQLLANSSTRFLPWKNQRTRTRLSMKRGLNRRLRLRLRLFKSSLLLTLLNR